MKKLLCIILSAVMVCGLLAFAGCKKVPENDTTTTDSSTEDYMGSTDAFAEDSTDGTEASTEGTTEASTKKNPSSQTKNPTKAPTKTPTNTPTVKPVTPIKPDQNSGLDSYKYNGSGKYACGSGKDKLVPGVYYIEGVNGKKCKLSLDFKKNGEDLGFENQELPYGTYIELKSGYNIEIKDGRIIHTSKAPSKKTADNVYKQGMYRVGADIPAGEYTLTLGSNLDESGLLQYKSADLVDPNLEIAIIGAEFPMYVTLKAGEYVEVVGTAKLSPVSSKSIAVKDANGNYTAAATYKVGKDIPAGTYTFIANSSGEAGYLIESSSYYFNNDPTVAYKDDIAGGQSVEITLKAGQYVTLLNGVLAVKPAEPSTEKESEKSTESSTEKASEKESEKSTEQGNGKTASEASAS